MAASEGALAAGLLLLSPSHVSPSLQDSFPHSLSYPGQRPLAEVLGRPTPFAISLLEDSPGIGQVMFVVLSPDSVLNTGSIGYWTQSSSLQGRSSLQWRYDGVRFVDMANQ